MAGITGGVSPPVSEDPKSLNLVYKWCEVGVLDYDEDKKLYLVHKTDKRGLVRDEMGKPILNGGVTSRGTSSASAPGWPPAQARPTLWLRATFTRAPPAWVWTLPCST